MRNMIRRSLTVNALQERYAGERIAKFQEIVEQNDLYRWAVKPEHRELRPDSLEYVPRPLIARLSALLP